MGEADDRLLDVSYKSDDEEDDGSDIPLLNPEANTTGNHKPFVLIEIPVFLYFVALVMQYPVVQFYLYARFSEEYGIPNTQNDTSVCDSSSDHSNHSISSLETEVQTKTNRYTMFMSFTCNFIAIIPTLLLGVLTDKFGRKFVYFISATGLTASQVLTVVIFRWRLAPPLLFVSSVLQGLSGSFGLFLSSIFGIVADFTTPGKQRAFRVTTAEAAMALGSSVGTITSGIWVKKMGYIWPTVFAIILVIISVIYVIFFVPETLVHRRHEPFTLRSLGKCFEFYIKDTPTKRRFKMLVYLFCFLTAIGCFIGESNFTMLYLLHQPFCWGKMHITIFSGLLVLVKWMLNLVVLHVGKSVVSELVLAFIGSVSLSMGYLLRGLAWDDILIYTGAGVSLLADMVSPMTRTLMSKAVSANEQGALFAGMGVLQMVVSSVSAIALSAVYEVGLTVFLGLPYMVLAGIIFINVILLFAVIIRMKLNPVMNEPPSDCQEQLVN